VSAAERAFRESTAKVVAGLVAAGFDPMTAEDAAAGAVAAALQRWEEHGPPASPEAWLWTVARRLAIDQARRFRRLIPLSDDLSHQPDPPEEMTDERLRMLYLCTHPAIASEVQTALMLQLVLGRTAEEIAQLTVMPPDAVAQRLVRAKRKIRDAGIRPELPSIAEIPARSAVVRQAVYGLYARGWERPNDSVQQEAANEALELAELLMDLQPDDPENLGLAALIGFCEARRRARTGPAGRFVPFDSQAVPDWDDRLWRQAETWLAEAAKRRKPSRFQWEAALQSAHMQRRAVGFPGWAEIRALYDRWIAVEPGWGNQVGRAAVTAKLEGAVTALAELDSLLVPDSFQPAWALRAALLRELGDSEAARVAADRAVALAEDPAVAQFLRETYGEIP
jgi:RNA polymerase sigma-70 factor (ECF subfamily)